MRDSAPTETERVTSRAVTTTDNIADAQSTLYLRGDAGPVEWLSMRMAGSLNLDEPRVVPAMPSRPVYGPKEAAAPDMAASSVAVILPDQVTLARGYVGTERPTLTRHLDVRHDRWYIYNTTTGVSEWEEIVVQKGNLT